MTEELEAKKRGAPEEVEPEASSEAPATTEGWNRSRVWLLGGLVAVFVGIFGYELIWGVAGVEGERLGQAPYHSRPIEERDGRRYLWAAGGPEIGAQGEVRRSETIWFDVTGAKVDVKTFQYGIGKDKIPAMDEPNFVEADDPLLERIGIGPDMEVIGYEKDGVAKAYPIPIMSRHELVNDEFGGEPLLVGW